MKLSARILRLLPPFLLGLSGLTALLQTLAYLLNYEAPDANYFETSAVFPALATGLCVATVLAGSLAALLIPKGECPEPAVWLGPRPHRVACAAAAVGFFAGAVVLAFSSTAVAARLAIPLLLLGGVYELLSGWLPARSRIWAGLTGFAAVLGCILVGAVYYFDTSLEMNAPVKVSVMIGVLCAMLFCTGEIRVLLGKPARRLLLLLGVWLLALGGLAALPVPLAALCGVFDRSTTPAGLPLLAQRMAHPEYLAGALIALGLAAAAGVRLWVWLRCPAGPDAARPGEAGAAGGAPSGDSGEDGAL